MTHTNGRNGTAKAPPTDLAALRQEVKRARLTAALREAEARIDLYESLVYDWSFGGSDLWDRLRPTSQDSDGTVWVPPTSPRDRAHGENWPVYRTEPELDELRQRSRILIAVNGLAQSLMDNLTNFVIGDGFKYKVQSKELAELEAEAKKQAKKQHDEQQAAQQQRQAAAQDQQQQEDTEQQRQHELALQQAKAAVQEAFPPPKSDVTSLLPQQQPEPPEDPRVTQLQAWVKRGQDVIDRFLKVNRWNGQGSEKKYDGSPVVMSREKEIFRRTYIDGEAFVRVFKDEDRRCIITRFCEPEQVRQPGGALGYMGWSFGIKHQMLPYEDVETRLRYHLWYQDLAAAQVAGERDGIVPELGADGEPLSPNGEYVDAQDMLHVLRHNALATIARGVPFFSFGVLDALSRADKVQRNTSLSAAVKAATAEIWQHSVGTQQQITDLASGLAGGHQHFEGGGQPVFRERMLPGGIRRVPLGQEPVFPAPDNSASFLEAAAGDKQYAAAAACGPSYWLGDAENANYSNLETASAPPVKNGQAVQQHFQTAFARVAWMALEFAVECGDLDAEALEALDLQVDGPAVLHRNELEDAQVRQVEASWGSLSVQTWCAEKGRDYEIEAANIEEHNQRFGQQAQQPTEGGGAKAAGAAGRVSGVTVKESKDAGGYEPSPGGVAYRRDADGWRPEGE